MNKFIKTLTLILMVCLLLCSFIIHSFAIPNNDGYEPYYVNAGDCTADFSISNGTASILVRYVGNASVFAKVEVSVKIQKRFLLVIWNDVDIGYPNNEWTTMSNNLNGIITKDFHITKTGYYRALITVNVYGTSGAVDTIEFTKEYQYN